MKTPAGKECRYYYADYYRGREKEECRLLQATPQQQRWTPNMCYTCPVPGILQSNACPHLTLRGRIERPFPFFQRKVVIEAYCTKTQREVLEPYIGCGECHPLPPSFME